MFFRLMRGAPIERWLRRGAALALVAVGLYLVLSAFEPFRINWGDRGRTATR
jgi:hypothetical protein